MNDMNWKSWLLVLVIGVGLMFEIFKHLPAGTTDALWDKENFSFGVSQSKPYGVKTAKAASARRETVAHSHPLPEVDVKQLKAFVAANTTDVQKTEFEHKEKGGEGKPEGKEVKEAKNPDDYEVFIDPATGKKYRRKKKKAKTEEKQEELAKKPEVKPEPKDDIESTIQTAIVTGQLPPVAATNKDAFVDLEEWMRRLLTYPNAKMTNLFIQQYQQSLVGADIFYKITKLMLQDSRVDMKQLGALCAGMTPSVMSFQILAGVQKTENSGTALRTSVDGFLKNYSNLENLSYLQRVLESTDTYGVVLAAVMVETSANLYLQPTPVNPQGGAQTQSTVSANAVKFEKFLVILQPLTKSHDANVNTQANQTYSTLQRLLGTPAATTPTTADGFPPTDGGQLVTTTQGP